MDKLLIEHFAINFFGLMKLPAPGANDMRVGDGFLQALPGIAIRFGAAVQDQEIKMVRQKGIEAKARRRDDVQQEREFRFGSERSHIRDRLPSWWRKRAQDRFRDPFHVRVRQPAP